MEHIGEVNTFNPAKDWAREGTLNFLIRHRDASNMARDGYLYGQIEPSGEEKPFNKVKGLSKMISVQREMILHSLSTVKIRCLSFWQKKNQTEEDQQKNPFEKEDNDYFKLLFIKKILLEAELDIAEAAKTRRKEIDYVVDYNADGKIKHKLTNKYFEMLEGLEGTYEEINLIMLKHKIISAGIEEDEVKTYKEQEQEAIRRIVEA